MRYWLFLIAKLVVAIGVTDALLMLVDWRFPHLPRQKTGIEQESLVVLIAVMAIYVLGMGLAYLAVWDQRRRCRTCLRRLVMPLATGSWSHMLISGRPSTEWICPYGHGTLRVSELHITGSELPDWQPNNDDIWQELESYDSRGR